MSVNNRVTLEQDDDVELDAMELAHLGHKLDSSHRNVERLLGWVSGADNKALIALTFQGAIVAGVAVMADPIRNSVAGAHAPWETAVAVLLLGGFTVFFCICSLKLFHVIAPRMAPPAKHDDLASLLFFGGIASMDQDEYVARMKDTSAADLHEALAEVAHATAKIATEKYADLSVAYRYFSYQLMFFLAALLWILVRPFQ